MFKNIVVSLMIVLMIPGVASAFSFDVDGATVEFDGDKLTVSDEEGEVVITEESIHAEGSEGSFDADNYEVSEDGSVTMEGVDIDFDDEEEGFLGLGDVIMLEEEEGVESDLKMKEITEDSIVFEENEKEVVVQMGVDGVKVSDNLGSVIAYYAESGIETSDIKIGDKSGMIYLDTDFGQVKIGALPLRLVREVVNKGVKIERVEFEWDVNGEKLNYMINGIKTQRLLWIIPISIDETHVMSVEDGALLKVNKSVWHSFLDMISF